MMTQKRQNRRKSIQHSDPGKILDLVVNLTEDNCAQLQIKINEYIRDMPPLFICHQIREECEADLVLLVVVREEHSEAFIEAIGSTVLQRKHAIRMCQTLTEVLRSGMEQSALLSNMGDDFKNNIISHMAQKDLKKRIFMFPKIDAPFSVIVCALAPQTLEERVTMTIHEAFLFVWPVLRKSIALEYECTLKEKCQQLLRVARRLFTKVSSLDNLLQIAMEQAKMLIKAEYCAVMLVDVDKMELVECGFKTKEKVRERAERRFKMGVGIAGYVVASGLIVNTRNAKEHPNFSPEVDIHPEEECKSMLCFPIRDESGILGVGRLTNKIGDPYFDAMDEEMALAFSVHCGMCIMHAIIYQKMQEANVRNALANELVMYHMKVSDNEVENLLQCDGYHNHMHFSSLHFDLRALPLRELPCYVIKMFNDLGFHNKFNIKTSKLARFVLHVQRGYRDVPYHNWFHAFNVAQWAYAAILNFKLVSHGYFNNLQALMYVIAALVHDLDHRGTTNKFHIKGQTTLAALYSSEGSVMERHHLAQAMCILNTEGCDLLEALPRRDYDHALILLRDYILATDLANYFKNLTDYQSISLVYQKGNLVHRSALQSLLMNAADLSDQLKDWSNVKKTAAAVLTEFFNQGDKEKSLGGDASSIMDRDKCFIPELQKEFLTTTCVPLFEMLGRIIPKAEPLLKVIGGHIEVWELAKPIFAEVPITGGLAVLLSPELDDLIEHRRQEMERKLQEKAEEEEK